MSAFLSMPLTLRSLRQQTQTPLLDGSNQAPTRCSAPASTSQCFENTACQVVCRGDWLSMFDIGFHDEHRAQNRDRPFARWNEPLGTSSGEPNHPSNKRPVGWRCLLSHSRYSMAASGCFSRTAVLAGWNKSVSPLISAIL